jgi:hypothetical protein
MAIDDSLGQLVVLTGTGAVHLADVIKLAFTKAFNGERLDRPTRLRPEAMLLVKQPLRLVLGGDGI